MKITGITVLALMVLAGTAIAQRPGGWNQPGGSPRGGMGEMAQGPGGPGGQGGFGMENLAQFRMLFRNLDLSDEQIEEIRSITQNAREETMAVMESVERPEDRTPLMEIFTSPTLTVRDLEDAVNQNEDLRKEIQGIIFQAMVDVHDVLTADQLEELAVMIEEHAGGIGPGSGMGRMPMR